MTQGPGLGIAEPKVAAKSFAGVASPSESPAMPTHPMPLPSFDSSGRRSPEIERILDLTVPCSVILAQRQMSIQSILGITVGTIMEFNVPFDADLTMYIANHPVAQGKAVKVGENFGLRIDHIDSIAHRIDALGGQ